ncbi:hypothetical protein [Winogradskyella sp.]|uniref:hypothetical protein n=1 Tax=Winogradskyella sp. TaxID=1883156 RepID=UPI001B17D1AF|nr:hypothetical protein [Winogradskyella sp.]MBO6879042.1 hypothetical protein [Winogradskyella sp.]
MRNKPTTNYFFFGEACGVFLGACLGAEGLPLDCVCPITLLFLKEHIKGRYNVNPCYFHWE